jgi:hypothetical protein
MKGYVFFNGKKAKTEWRLLEPLFQLNPHLGEFFAFADLN